MGRPLAGAEQFTRRFPRTVLVSFLWSMPYLLQLADKTETEVVESYLEARFRQAFPQERLPEGLRCLASPPPDTPTRWQESQAAETNTMGSPPHKVKHYLIDRQSGTSELGLGSANTWVRGLPSTTEVGIDHVWDAFDGVPGSFDQCCVVVDQILAEFTT